MLGAPYYDVTQEGWVILHRFLDSTGQMSIVGYRPERGDYFASRGYDVFRGGANNLVIIVGSTDDYAIDGLARSTWDPPLTVFDPEDPRDVEFYLDSNFYAFNVHREYLRTHDHMQDSFDPYQGWFDKGSREDFDSERNEMRRVITRPTGSRRRHRDQIPAGRCPA